MSSEKEKKSDGFPYLSDDQKKRWKEIKDFLGDEEAIKRVKEKAMQYTEVVPAVALANAIDFIWEQIFSKAPGAG